MSSYIMHMCISDIVKRKLNLTDKFVYGSILPDILKMSNRDREGTHYLKKVQIDGTTRNLPVIDKAIHDLKIEDSEIRMGYIAHLVEDLIWFNEFIPKFTKKVEEDKFLYLKTKEIKDAKNFTEDIYLEYLNSGAYVIKTTNTDIEKLKKNILKYITEEKCLSFVVDNTNYTAISDVEKNIFMTKDCIDHYIIKTTKAVENIVKELIGD